VTPADRADKVALLHEAAALLKNEPAAAANLRTVAEDLTAQRSVPNLDWFVASARMIVKGLG